MALIVAVGTLLLALVFTIIPEVFAVGFLFSIAPVAILVWDFPEDSRFIVPILFCLLGGGALWLGQLCWVRLERLQWKHSFWLMAGALFPFVAAFYAADLMWMGEPLKMEWIHVIAFVLMFVVPTGYFALKDWSKARERKYPRLSSRFYPPSSSSRLK